MSPKRRQLANPEQYDEQIQEFALYPWKFAADSRIPLETRIAVLRAVEFRAWELDLSAADLAASRHWLRELRAYTPAMFKAFEARGFKLESRGGGMYAFEKHVGPSKNRSLVVVERHTPMAPLNWHTIVSFGIEDSDDIGLIESVWYKRTMTAKSFLSLYDRVGGAFVPDAQWETEDV